MSKELFEAKMELNRFLEEHPHLKPFQAKLDSQLNNAGSNHNRMVILKSMLFSKLYELERALNNLIETHNKRDGLK